jgi:type IV pilus biogenesis protein CpaD/CtpE
VKVKLGRIVQQICFKMALIVVVAAGLSACATQQSMRKAAETTDRAPTAPVMTPLQYSWDTNYSAMLTPPIEIRDKALIACNQRGFDRAYMQSLSLNEDNATAYFSCRGSDQ